MDAAAKPLTSVPSGHDLTARIDHDYRTL